MQSRLCPLRLSVRATAPQVCVECNRSASQLPIRLRAYPHAYGSGYGSEQVTRGENAAMESGDCHENECLWVLADEISVARECALCLDGMEAIKRP